MRKSVYGVLAAAVLGAVMISAPAQAKPVDFEVTLGDVQFGYTDGYYDSHRHWHRWHNSAERKWYLEHHQDSYFKMTRSHDHDHNHNDWRNGKRDDWH